MDSCTSETWQEQYFRAGLMLSTFTLKHSEPELVAQGLWIPSSTSSNQAAPVRGRKRLTPTVTTFRHGARRSLGCKTTSAQWSQCSGRC